MESVLNELQTSLLARGEHYLLWNLKVKTWGLKPAVRRQGSGWSANESFRKGFYPIFTDGLVKSTTAFLDVSMKSG